MSLHSKLINNIKSSRDLDESLPIFFNEIMDKYNQMSTVRLTLNYYMFYELISEDVNNRFVYLKENLCKVNKIIKKYYRANADISTRQEDLAELDLVRNDFISKMNSIVNYSAAFSIAEYILNRVEHRFDGKIVSISDAAIVETIVEYIFADKDNVVVNDKIKLVIGQLPVRITRTKLFNIISNCFTLYKDADKSSVDNFVDLLKTNSMINLKDEDTKMFKGFDEKINILLEADYSEITQNKYTELSGVLKECCENINLLSDLYSSFVEIINDIYEIIISCAYSMDGNSNVNNACYMIIDTICKSIDDGKVGDVADVYEKVSDELVKVEGVQENLSVEIDKLESVLYSIRQDKKDVIEALMLSPVLHCANVCCMLNSSSMFADISSADNDDAVMEKVDEKYVESVRDEFIKELSEVLNKKPANVRRAIMASVLSQLPVHFRNSDEVQEYVAGSIASCKDEAEKAAVFEILSDITGE